jgi:hypothetical protein
MCGAILAPSCGSFDVRKIANALVRGRLVPICRPVFADLLAHDPRLTPSGLSTHRSSRGPVVVNRYPPS